MAACRLGRRLWHRLGRRLWHRLGWPRRTAGHLMTARKPFLLRLDPATLEALQAWAADDLRSVNGQVEFLLRRSLREAGRLRGASRARSDGAAARPTASSRADGRGPSPDGGSDRGA